MSNLLQQIEYSAVRMTREESLSTRRTDGRVSDPRRIGPR